MAPPSWRPPQGSAPATDDERRPDHTGRRAERELGHALGGHRRRPPGPPRGRGRRAADDLAATGRPGRPSGDGAHLARRRPRREGRPAPLQLPRVPGDRLRGPQGARRAPQHQPPLSGRRDRVRRRQRRHRGARLPRRAGRPGGRGPVPGARSAGRHPGRRRQPTPRGRPALRGARRAVTSRPPASTGRGPTTCCCSRAGPPASPRAWSGPTRTCGARWPSPATSRWGWRCRRRPRRSAGWPRSSTPTAGAPSTCARRRSCTGRRCSSPSPRSSSAAPSSCWPAATTTPTSSWRWWSASG